jgi:zinc/manganese transport system substrate-binding protein
MVPKKRAGRLVSWAAIALSATVVAGCGIPQAGPGQIAAVGVETQYADVIAQIGGPYVSVVALMNNPSADPHNFEANTSVAREIAQAGVVVQNGDGYDSFVDPIETATASSRRQVLTVARLRHQVGAANPHFWYDPSTMPLVARAVTAALSKLAPRHASYFHSRETDFLLEWSRVTRTVARARARLAGRRVATTEPVGDDLLRALGLVNVTPWRFQADVMNGVDPSPEDLATQESLLARHRVYALVYNAQVQSPVTSALRAAASSHAVATVAVSEIMAPHDHVQRWFAAAVARLLAALHPSTRSESR